MHMFIGHIFLYLWVPEKNLNKNTILLDYGDKYLNILIVLFNFKFYFLWKRRVKRFDIKVRVLSNYVRKMHRKMKRT